MSKIIHIKPAQGVRVLDPDAIPPEPLPEEGKKVVQCPYWTRRISTGEVTLVEELKVLSENQTTASDKIPPTKGK